MAQASQTEKLPGLHAMRLFAALAVFIGHSNFAGLDFQPALYHWCLYYAPLALPMFFGASAFALMYTTRNAVGKPYWVWKFYSKRFWRVAPLFYVACIASIIIEYPRAGMPSWDALVSNALLINNLIPQHAMSLAPAGWTVGAEVIFYIVFPLLLLYVRTLWAAFGVLIVSIIVSQLVREPFSQFPQLIGTYADFSVVTFAPSFACGVIAFLVFERLRAAGWAAPDLARRRVWAFHAFFMGVTLVIGAIIYYQIEPLREAGRADLVLAAIFYGFVTVWWTVRPARWHSWGVIQYQAECSFSIYLMHALIVRHNVFTGRATYLYLEPYIGGWAMTPALIVMYIPVIIVSVITYHAIERRGVGAGRAFDALFKPKVKSGPAPEAA